MKKIISLIICFSSINSITAQQWQWAHCEIGQAGTDIQTDSYGNVFVLATVNNTVYGNNPLTCGNTGQIIAKHDAAGNIIWARGLGINTSGSGFSLDKLGNIYITGSVQFSTTFCGGNNPNISLSLQGGQQSDAFLCKYTNNGDLLWVQTWGAIISNDGGNAIKTDFSGNSYISGIYRKLPYQSGGLMNFFVRKYDSFGNLLWDENSNWKGGAYPTDIDIDLNGNSYITGYFIDSAFFGGTSFNANANHTIFIAKYNKNGNLIWAKKDGTNYDESYGICLDKKGNFYITGINSSPSTFGGNTISTGGFFVAKYDTSGTIVWARGSIANRGNDISVDSSGACFILGAFTGTASFANGANTATLTTLKAGDIFVAKYDKNGNFVWAIAPGGTAGYSNFGYSISCDMQNNCYITGLLTATTVFGNTVINTTTVVGQSCNLFIAKLKDTVAILTRLRNTSKLQNNLVVFPNPAEDQINILLKSFDYINDIEINIRNEFCELVYSEYYKGPGLNSTQDGMNTFTMFINVAKYARGIYLLEVINKGQPFVKMVVLN